MPEATVDDKDARRLNQSLVKLPAQFRAKLDKAVEESARELAKETRAVLRSARKGRRKKGETVKPSQPGQPPAVQSGVLARSVRVRRGKKRRSDINWRVATAFYGRFLETGASRPEHQGGKLLPRPFATIARKKQASAYVERVGAAVREVLEEVAAS